MSYSFMDIPPVIGKIISFLFQILIVSVYPAFYFFFPPPQCFFGFNEPDMISKFLELFHSLIFGIFANSIDCITVQMGKTYLMRDTGEYITNCLDNPCPSI